jgi:murein tripeptide amidase MpaA
MHSCLQPSGRQLLLALADHLCKVHATGLDPEVVRLLESVSLFIIPTMNPDGYDAHDRTNR